MMRSRDLLSLILSLLLVAALSVSSRAQAVYGSVFGTMTDPQGARVVGAVVTVTELTKNVTTTAQTNESGNYTVTHLIPGRYSVKVEQQGYKIILQEVEVKFVVLSRVDFFRFGYGLGINNCNCPLDQDERRLWASMETLAATACAGHGSSRQTSLCSKTSE